MTLQEVFSQLTYGELSQLNLGINPDGTPNEAQQDALIGHVNLGLAALYRRFPLKQGRITVALQEGRTTYPLHSAYSVTTRRSREPVRFILDSADFPFTDDISKVEQVFTDAGHEMALNDGADPLAIVTPAPTTLRVPPAVVGKANDLPAYLKTEKLEVVYRATHPMIVKPVGYFDPSRVELELPYTHLEALLYFIASRAYSPTGMVNEFDMGNSFAAKYERACQEIEFVNMRVDQGANYDRIQRNGWV